ncbi:MAG: hypothetical protein AAFX93_11170 [Verrucomicrobiota bacterium]
MRLLQIKLLVRNSEDLERLFLSKMKILIALMMLLGIQSGHAQFDGARLPDPTRPNPVTKDPSSPNPITKEALDALRRSGNSTSSNDDKEVDIDYILVGLVIGGDVDSQRGVALIAVDEKLFLVGEGQTIRSGDHDITATQIDGDSIIVFDNKANEAHVLRKNVLGLPDEEGKLSIVEFAGIPLPFAMQALSYVTNLHIAVSSEARDTAVTLFLRNVTPEEALETLVATHQLYSSPINGSDILRLQTVEEFARGSTTFREERSRVFTLRFPNARDIALSIRDLFGERVRLSERIDESEEPGEFLTDDLEQRLERFDIIAGRSQGLGTTSDTTTNGSNFTSNRLSSSSFNSNQTQNFRDTGRRNDQFNNRNRFDLTEEELRLLGTVDATRIEAIRDARADIFVSVIDRLNKLLIRTRDEHTMEEIAVLIEELDQPAKLVFLEVRILQVQLDDGLDTAFNWSFNAGGFSGSFSPGNPTVNGNFVFSYLNDTFRADLQLLQDRDKLTVLGQPALMTANNEVSRIFIGEQVPVLVGFGDNTTVVTDLGNTVNFANAEYVDQDVGSTLLITPNINDDDTVELRLLQEESQIVRNGANILVPDGDGTFDERAIDIVAAQTVSGTFIAANNRTFAIGGLIQESIEDERSQIPVLGDLPLIGRAFRNQATTRTRNEIILLITPSIIENPSHGETLAQDYVDRHSLYPDTDIKGGNLGVFNEDEVLVPGEPANDPPEEALDALFHDRFGPRR